MSGSISAGGRIRWANAVVVFGVSNTQGNLRALEKSAPRAFTRGCRIFLEKVGEKSQEQVPRQTGHLARSMRITVHQNPGGGTIKYDTPYAAMVHEIPRPASSNGKWKYLEDPLKEMLPDLERIIGNEVAAELAR